VWLHEDAYRKRKYRTSISVISPPIYEGLQMLAIFDLRIVFFAQVSITFRFGGIELCEIP
jgi:hypothetical protein